VTTKRTTSSRGQQTPPIPRVITRSEDYDDDADDYLEFSNDPTSQFDTAFSDLAVDLNVTFNNDKIESARQQDAVTSLQRAPPYQISPFPHSIVKNSEVPSVSSNSKQIEFGGSFRIAPTPTKKRQSQPTDDLLLVTKRPAMIKRASSEPTSSYRSIVPACRTPLPSLLAVRPQPLAQMLSMKV